MEIANFAFIEPDLCKGCRLCVETCPSGCLEMGTQINKLGYQFARFVNWECTACGMCFYACPEPGAIRVYRKEPVDESAHTDLVSFVHARDRAAGSDEGSRAARESAV